MFRDVHYVTYDYSVRVQYGFAIFRWWQPYMPKEVTDEGQSESTRLSLYIEGLEFHVYNRSNEYARLERLFNMDELMIPESERLDTDETSERQHLEASQAAGSKRFQWRDLIPVIKVDMSEVNATSCQPIELSHA